MKYFEPKIQENDNKGEIDFLSLKENKSYHLRILPPYDESGIWYVYERKHFLKHSAGFTTLPCRNQKANCLMCRFTEYMQIQKDNPPSGFTTKDIEKIIQDTRSSVRVLLNVLDRDDDNKLKLLRMPYSVFKQFLQYLEDKDWGHILHPEEGHDITITKSGKGFQTEYALKVSPKQTPLGVEIDNGDLVNLEKFITAFQEKYKDQDYLQAIELAYPEFYDGFMEYIGRATEPTIDNGNIEELDPGIENPFEE